MADNDILGIKPWDTERFVKSQSSDHSNESSTYCVFCNHPISISHGSNLSSSSEGYVSFTNIAHAVQIHIPRAHISYHNRVLPGDNVEYGIGTRHTTTTNDPAVQMHIPRPYISYPNTGDSDKIDPTSVPYETREEGPPNHRSCIPGFHSMILTRKDYPILPVPHVEDNEKPDTNTNWRCIKQVVFVVLMCLFVSAVVAFIVINKNVDDPVPTPFPPGKEYFVSPGERIFVPYDDLHNTSNISHITMQQTSSAYSYNLFQFNMSVNSTVSNFTRYVDDWIVYYDILRINETLRLVQPNAYCSSPGKYSVILEYTDAFHTSFEFEVRMKDPQLHQSITSDDHVHCELTGTCLPSSLAIYVNVNNSAVLVPDSRACSYNDKKTGTMVSIEATIPSSMFTKNQSISCVPLMRNQELAENLTNTIHFVPKCPGPECKPNCKDVSTNTSTYYPHSVYCDKFYQCSNGEAIEQPCSDGTYWEPTKCGCHKYTTTICDMNNNTRIIPLRTLNPCFGKIDSIT